MNKIQSFPSRSPVCPNCLCKIKSVVGTYFPADGDIAVCVECGAPVIFDKDLKARLLSGKEVAGIGLEVAMNILVSQQIIANNFNRKVEN